MNTDPRVQKFYDEASAAKKELRRLAMDIAGWRIEHADVGFIHHPWGTISTPPLAHEVIPDVVWSMKNGRLDVAVRIIEMVDQYNNSMGSASMMQARVEHEQHLEAVRSMQEGDMPDYLNEDDEDGTPIRLSGEQAAALFSTFDEKGKR
jgi:hypothetical protein